MTYIFVLFCGVDDHIRIGWAFVFAFSFSILAFLLNWLTLDGVRAAVLFGTIAYGIGQFLGASIVLGFFVSSSLISQNQVVKFDIDQSESKKFRRNGAQVWANGFWFVLFVIIWFLSKEEIFLVAAISSIAAANADTWATELGGNFKPGKTVLITNFQSVEPGTDGAVSLKGFLASIIGAAIIGAIFYLFRMDGNWAIPIVITISGFAATIVDSVLGATIQNANGDKYRETDKFRIDNNLVNWMASGSGAILSILIYFFI